VLLCLTKRDLVTTDFCQQWCDRLGSWGYQPLVISTQTQEGIEGVATALSTGVTVITGQSGVGKTSLINLLIPDLDLRVGAVSLRLGYGKHTTRHVELFPIGNHGLLADTPGFTQPALTCAPTDLIDYFPELRLQLQDLSTDICQFYDCLHVDEPNCMVRGDWERYTHYCLFLKEVIAYNHKNQAIATADHKLKSKSGVGGEVQAEPRLVTKTHRRRSRRSNHQQLDTSFQDDLD